MVKKVEKKSEKRCEKGVKKVKKSEKGVKKVKKEK